MTRASDLTIPVRPDVGDVLGSRSPTRQPLLVLCALSPVVPNGDAKDVSTTFDPSHDPIPWLLAQFEALTAAHERALARVDRLEAALSSALTGPGCLSPRCQARLHYSQFGSRMDRSGCCKHRSHRSELPRWSPWTSVHWGGTQRVLDASTKSLSLLAKRRSGDIPSVSATHVA